VSIGLETDLSLLLKTGNGKPAYVFVIAQLFNILLSDRLKPGLVINVEGETAHTVGALTSGEAMSDEEWHRQIINQGTVGILEIACNQLALPGETDPATLRISDLPVEKVKSLLKLSVSFRHMDPEWVSRVKTALHE
jgi:hypothetical protein